MHSIQDPLPILPQYSLPLSEVTINQIRSQGAGGQNVNKVATAVQLRFNIHGSSLPEKIKRQLLEKADSRITRDGVIIIKAQTQRTFERNREEALMRLATLIRRASVKKKKRRPTAPTKASQKKRLDRKIHHGRTKQLRKKIT